MLANDFDKLSLQEQDGHKEDFFPKTINIV